MLFNLNKLDVVDLSLSLILPPISLRFIVPSKTIRKLLNWPEPAGTDLAKFLPLNGNFIQIKNQSIRFSPLLFVVVSCSTEDDKLYFRFWYSKIIIANFFWKNWYCILIRKKFYYLMEV